MSAILFDMDGTLVDSEPLWLEAEIEVMESVGCNWTQEDQLLCLGGPRERTESIMQERSKGVKPIGFFGDQLDLIMARKLKEELSLIPNALEIISECRDYGLKVALVTASGGVLMNNVLQRFPEDFFDTTVCADDVVKSKPDPAPYLLAAQKLKVDITKCVVVEDSITGVTSGLASGAQVIGIPHLVNLPVNDNLRIVKALSDLSLDKLLLWYPFLTGVVND